jgi:hypothetical protein
MNNWNQNQYRVIQSVEGESLESTTVKLIWAAQVETQLQGTVANYEKKVSSPYAGLSWDEAETQALEDGKSDLAWVYREAWKRWDTIIQPGRRSQG